MSMSRSCEDILALFQERKSRHGVVAARMRQIRDNYNGDVVIPLPELERDEAPAVANLTAMGLDQIGARIASTVPDPRYPTHRIGKAAEESSRNKRRATLGWWEGNLMDLKLGRRARHLVGYGISPVLIRPDFKRGYPRWELKDPLATYPAPSADPDDPCVDDAIFAVKRSYGWLKRNYAEAVIGLATPRDCPSDLMFEVLEYVDDEVLVTCVVGQTDNDGYGSASGRSVVELQRLPNRGGICPAVVPGRINLDRRMGQFDGMVGMHQMQARLFALEAIAVEKGIFPDEWIVARQNETPDVIQVADGRRGVIGIIQGGDLREKNLQPGYQTNPTIDRLERSQRITAGIPAEFGGESQSNVRTGRRGENILSATIDFGIQEAQRVLSASLSAENCRAIAIDRGYHDTAKSFYVSWYKAKGHVDYKPSELFDTDRNVVSYAHAGTDVNGLVVSGGQRVGMGTLSKRGFMELDPLIDDPESEFDRITAESLEFAMLQGLQAQASQGAIPPADLARIMELVKTDKADLAEAIQRAQREAQERQAAQVEAQSPEAQPGLAVPGAGAESTPIPEEPLGPSPENLSRLLASLRRPQALTAPGEAARPEAMV